MSTRIVKNKAKKLRQILVSDVNYERLRNLGRTRDSFNDVITRILDGEIEIK